MRKGDKRGCVRGIEIGMEGRKVIVRGLLYNCISRCYVGTE